MTASRAPANPEVTWFEAAVAEVDGRDLLLEETYFYPEGGGQPADRGTIEGIPVTDVQVRNGQVVHVLDRSPELEPEAAVEAQVDPTFRAYCRRAHSASHVLYGAGRRLLEDLGYGGFGITPEKVRVDFQTSTTIDDTELVDMERLVNRAVWDARPVSWEVRDVEAALTDPEIAFNTKTEEGITGDDVRVVTIEDWDVAACGGTHVSNTIEIGPVAVLERSNPGEGLTRIEFSVGPHGIQHRAGEKAALLEAAAAAGTGAMDVAEEVWRLRDEVEDLETTIDGLEGQVAEFQLGELRTQVQERDGREWLAGAVEGLDANALSDHAKALAGDAADVVALVGQDGRTFVVVADHGESDAAAVVQDVTDEFGGGGGGSPQFAQGGGIDADPTAVVGYLREPAADQE